MANPVVFKRNFNVGAGDAESDATFLTECFVDTGDVKALLDCANSQTLILGRTGSGKTALLQHLLSNNERVVELAPEDLALNYVSNSNILQFFEEAGVSLEAFYILLWRHIVTVELLKMKYNITDQNKQTQFFMQMRNLTSRDRAKERALKYIEDWGDHFWEETEYRTKEFTRKLETELKTNAKVDAKYLTLGADGARKLSKEETVEVREAGARIVNSVQVKELHDVISLLGDDIFIDEAQPYYILVDRLDEDWVSGRIKSKLIKALLESVRSFRKVRTVKIIFALRTDLLQRVLSETVTIGFQEEKYKSLYLNLHWTRDQLTRLLNERIKFMFKRQYTNQTVSLTDIMPTNQVEQRNSIDYILDRTFLRPREAIMFLNECITRSEGKSKITLQILKDAESTYSKQRMTSLADEWRADYPNLSKAIGAFKNILTPFSLSDLKKDQFEKFAYGILEKDDNKDQIYIICQKCFLEDSMIFDEFIKSLITIMYQVGVIGVKPDPHSGRQWSYMDEPMLDEGQLTSHAQMDIHKTFWAVLGISKRVRTDR